MLYTKSIYKPKLGSDGLRISVMSRHTLNDGVTPDIKITRGSYDLWLKVLAPPDNLVYSYYKEKLSFEEYIKEYLRYLSRKKISIEVAKISKIALKQNITFLCVESSAEKCHRRILAEECKKYFQHLKIEHR